MVLRDKKIIPDAYDHLTDSDGLSRLLIGNCPKCKEVTRMLFPLNAARIAEVSSRRIYQLIESDALHFIETTEKVLLICSKSLNTHIEDQIEKPKIIKGE